MDSRIKFSCLFMLFIALVSLQVHTEEMLPAVQLREIGPKKEKVKILRQAQDRLKIEEEKDKKAVQYELRVKPEKRKFEFHLTGGLAFEAMYDSRQVVGDRFDQFIFVPAAQRLDSRGLDINAKDQFNMMGVRACCAAHVKGPDIWDAKTSAVIEGEFNGIDDNTVRLFRLIRAHGNLDWRNTHILFGHYFHPLVLDEIFPETVSRGQGRVYDPYDYAPQIKFRHRVREFEFVFAIAKRFDSQPARWAAVPDLFGQINLFVRNNIFGAGINYHAEVPRIFSQIPPSDLDPDTVTETYKTTEQINSLTSFVFAALKFEPFDVRLRCTYAENASVYDLIGAYAVRYRNERTDERMYINLKTIAFWGDFIYKKWGRIEPAVFVGVTKNLGASKKIVKGYDYEGTDDFVPLLVVPDSTTNIDYTFICAPRIRVRFGEFALGAEIEYTRALHTRSLDEENWEDDFDDRGRVICGRAVSNFRLLLATFYNFDYMPFSYK